MTMATSVYDRLRQDVLHRLDSERLDPADDADRITELIAATVSAYQHRAEHGTELRLANPHQMVNRLVASITAFGPLTNVLERCDVEEIFIEGARVTYLDRTGRLHGLDHPTSEEENRSVIDRLLSSTTRSLDARTPLVQARVLDGDARLSVAIPPVSETLSATIRRHASRHLTLNDLVNNSSLSSTAAAFLTTLMQGWSSIVVSGQPGAGKTSILGALVHATPTSRCVRVCEEIRELSIPLTHGSFYETRPPSASGDAEIDLRSLLRFCLGMRSELIVVGEVRGAEAFELTRAVNAGCGFACTVHSNSGHDALEALTNAAIMAGEQIPESLVRKVFSSAIDVVVHADLCDTVSGSHREVREIVAVLPSVGEVFATEPIFTRPAGPGTPLVWTGTLPTQFERFDRFAPHGRTLRDICAGKEAS